MTQEQLADRAGLTAKGVSALERGERQRPYAHTVRALATALQLSDDELEALRSLIPARGAPRPAPAPQEPESPAPLPPLPQVLTPLVGREKDVAAVLRLLDAGGRLVTLTGPGGVGKSRLAIRVAEAMAERFRDGIIFVALAPVKEAGRVLSAIAATLNLQESGEVPVFTLLERALQPRETLLLLDNFEQVADAAPEVSALLSACPRLHLLVTSRMPLRVRGEQEYPVPPLDLPSLEQIPEVEEVRLSPAVDLFVQRARAASPHFNLTPANATTVTAICRRLDGLPLALELAAARVKLLPPTTLLARLDHSLPLLVGGARDLPERQQTMRRTIDWSYTLLNPAEQQLLRTLAVFAGGWDLEAAEAVAGNSFEVLDGLGRLVDHSLVVTTMPGGEVRYRLLEPVREYLLERLSASGEEEAARRRHASWYCSLARRIDPALTHEELPYWLDLLGREYYNFRTALEWYRARGDAESMSRIGWTLWRYWNLRGSLAEGIEWMGQALSLAGGTTADTLSRITVVLGSLLFERGEMKRVEALTSARLSGQEATERGVHAALLLVAGAAQMAQGIRQEASRLLDRAIDAAEADDCPHWKGVGLALKAQTAIHEDDLAGATRLLEDAEAILRGEGALWELTICLDIRSIIPQVLEEPEQILDVVGDSLALSLQLKETSALPHILEGIAGALALKGNAASAAHLFGAADALRARTGGLAHTSGFVHELYERYVALVRERLDDTHFDEAWRNGASMPLREAIALAQRAVAGPL